MPKINPIISNPPYTKQNQSPIVTHFTTVKPKTQTPILAHLTTQSLESQPMISLRLLPAKHHRHVQRWWRLEIHCHCLDLTSQRFVFDLTSPSIVFKLTHEFCRFNQGRPSIVFELLFSDVENDGKLGVWVLLVIDSRIWALLLCILDLLFSPIYVIRNI